MQSLLENEWVFEQPAPKEYIDENPEFPLFLLHTLFARGIQDKKAIEHFLYPKLETHSHDPFLFSHMQRAVDRVFYAIQKKEKIWIHGDYDADGIDAAAILFSTISALGGIVDVFLPHRERDGYGINPRTIDELKIKNAAVLISCDCGIANVDEIAMAQHIGIDVIITDHHQFKEILPPAYAILHPKIPGEIYPDASLSGGGVAFKFAQGLLMHAKKIDHAHTPKDVENFIRSLLDLVAISSVADMVPLIGETRALVKEGINELRKGKRIGIARMLALLKKESATISASDIGFYIAPRINAPGRLMDARISFDLLITENEERAEDMLQNIFSLNDLRAELTKKALTEARTQVAREIQQERPVLFAYSETWQPGIVGLIANRLKEEYNRPVLVMSCLSNQIVGSGRSIPEINIVEAMGRMPHFFSKFGGHPQACGFTIARPELLHYFESQLCDEVKKMFTKGQPSRTLHIDTTLAISDLTTHMLEIVGMLEPYGIGNEKPLFASCGVRVHEARAIGSSKSTLLLNVSLPDGTERRKYIGFGKAKFLPQLRTGACIDIAYEIGENIWNGRRELELQIKDIRV